MFRLSRCLLIVLVAMTIALAGCRQQRPPVDGPYPNSAMGVALTKIEYPDVEVPSRDSIFPIEPPRTLRTLADVKYWELSLEETIRLALLNSNVLRDLGGAVTRSPDSVQVTTDPSLQETDPRFGVEAALSNFDATLNSRLNAERLDRRVNNRFLGRLGFLQGDNDNWDTELAKQSATGTRFAVRQHIDSSRDNNPGNQFVYPNDAWNVW
ncbi:MAG: hypothetical protein JF612_08970, partial [Planctomycetia bacterium]|nr:hypothetical protein [Planctomycetia bacterium]